MGGEVVSIFITPSASAALSAVQEARAIPGRGLAGDRYFNQVGTFWKFQKSGQDVTLVETEALETLERDYGIKLDPRQSRRNILTVGIALNDLVGREFNVGEVVLRGVRLCEPCGHLEGLTGRSLIPGLSGRGGLRADVLKAGVVRLGDPVGIVGNFNRPSKDGLNSHS